MVDLNHVRYFLTEGEMKQVIRGAFEAGEMNALGEHPLTSQQFAEYAVAEKLKNRSFVAQVLREARKDRDREMKR